MRTEAQRKPVSQQREPDAADRKRPAVVQKADDDATNSNTARLAHEKAEREHGDRGAARLRRHVRSGDTLAKRLGVSRSELYARALAEFIAKHKADQITQRLNAVYAAEGGRLDPALAAAQSRALPRESW